MNLRSFLLFKDKTMEIQRGLVIFIINAENVFGPRSNQKKRWSIPGSLLGTTICQYGNWGRMVTLADVSCYLNNGNDDRHKVPEMSFIWLGCCIVEQLHQVLNLCLRP